jgi:5'-nucleotidase
MPFSLQHKLVIAVASSALFDLTESHAVYVTKGVTDYRKFQRDHETDVLARGVAFGLIQRLLSLNGDSEKDRVVEVILLSRNDPDTGLRVLNSMKPNGLDITRAVFVSGGNPCIYLKAFDASLFLSANEDDVKSAIKQNAPAGRVFPTEFVDDNEPELRVAFDFDGVITDDSAELIFQFGGGLKAFQQMEIENATIVHPLGPLFPFFAKLAELHELESLRKQKDPEYKRKLRIAIVTARNAPAHERVVRSLRAWGINVDDAFFLGGIEKARVLEVYRPHIFFDDQVGHIEGAARVAPCAHVPFGVMNDAAKKLQAFGEILTATPVGRGHSANKEDEKNNE